MTPVSTVTGRFSGSWCHGRGHVTEAEAQSALPLPPDRSFMFLSFLLSLSKVSAGFLLRLSIYHFILSFSFPFWWLFSLLSGLLYLLLHCCGCGAARVEGYDV